MRLRDIWTSHWDGVSAAECLRKSVSDAQNDTVIDCSDNYTSNEALITQRIYNRYV